jgi:uncharacterized protein (TIGR03000 family)
MSRIALFLSAVALLAPTPWARGQAKDEGQPAQIRVLSPADAKVTVDGTATKQTGSVRRFISPPLTPGKRYVYVFKAIWTEDSQEKSREEKINVEAGKVTEVDLRPLAVRQEKRTTEDPERTPDVVYWPTPQEVVDKMLELAKLKKEDLVYDLGCGDARILVTAAKKYGAKGLGVDIDPERIKDSLENVKKNKVEDLVTIKKQDIFTMDLSKANVVTLYLLPSLNVKLMPQLAKLKPGSRIVSHDFDMKGAKPNKVVHIRAKNHMGVEGEHTIYLWIVPWETE